MLSDAGGWVVRESVVGVGWLSGVCGGEGEWSEVGVPKARVAVVVVVMVVCVCGGVCVRGG